MAAGCSDATFAAQATRAPPVQDAAMFDIGTAATKLDMEPDIKGAGVGTDAKAGGLVSDAQAPKLFAPPSAPISASASQPVPATGAPGAGLIGVSASNNSANNAALDVYSYNVDIGIPSGALVTPTMAGMARHLGSKVGFSFENHAHMFPKDAGALRRVELVGTNNTNHTVGFGVNGLPGQTASDTPVSKAAFAPTPGTVYNLRGQGDHFAASVLADKYTVTDPVTVWTAPIGANASLERGLSREEIDAYNHSLVDASTRTISASSPVFDALAKSEHKGVMTGQLLTTLNGWREMAAKEGKPMDNMPIMLSPSVAAAYDDVADRLVQKHQAWLAAQVDPSKMTVWAQTHSAPSIAVPPSELVHQAVSPQGHAIGTPIDGYHESLPASHSVGFRVNLYYDKNVKA